ncbi:MAG TPA: NUDIX domain-containing protein [Myxococcota bacterium]|nr:NUDIX domain-containing protein [Myxococcota bacterium]
MSPERKRFGLGTAVYAERDGKILILKRATGEASGAWYTPGGGLDPGEEPAECARRELYEETGLVPSGPLELVGLVPMTFYGAEGFVVAFACACLEGEPSLSHEHSAARWVDPLEYRDRYCSTAAIEKLRPAHPEIAALITAVRRSMDEYLAWLARRARAPG